VKTDSQAYALTHAQTLADPGEGAIRPWPHHGFMEGPAPLPPYQAAEGIVKGRWIIEISRTYLLAS